MEYTMKKAMFLLVFCLTAFWLAAQNPEWLWAKQAGGTDSDYGYDVATDSSGNSYVTGLFMGTVTFGSTTITSNGDRDVFIAKLDTNGNHLWAKQAGGATYDNGIGIATDSCGNSYVTGFFTSTATFGATTLTSSGGSDIFIAKLDTDGNWLWVKQAGSANADIGHGIATDSSGNSYVTGWFESTATFGSTTITSNGDTDIFIAKLDNDGNWLWTKQAGGTNNDDVRRIATDSNGNSYVIGNFRSTVTFGTTTLTSSGYQDIFIAKLDINGNWLWVRKAGGASTDYGMGIATDISGNSYLTGYFSGTAFFGTTTITSIGGSDIFITKLDTDGNWLWTKQAGGEGNNSGRSIAIDSSGNSYVTGYFLCNVTFGSTTLTSSGYDDIYIVKLNTDGNWLWAKQAGGASFHSVVSTGIATDCSGNNYVTGYFNGTVSFGATSLTSSEDSTDIFVAKLSSSTMVSDEYGVPQAHFSLGQNHPNPFINSTSFELEVSDAKSVYEVAIYDLRGRRICTLYRGVLPAGKQTFTWNGKDAAEHELSSGVYFYRVSNGITSQVKKMIYVR